LPPVTRDAARPVPHQAGRVSSPRGGIGAWTTMPDMDDQVVLIVNIISDCCHVSSVENQLAMIAGSVE
jgi:hypothetical protein